jgi:outer membrane protein assembly factor BamE
MGVMAMSLRVGLKKGLRAAPGLRYNASIIALSQRWIDMDPHTNPRQFGLNPFKGLVAVVLCLGVMLLSACSYVDDPLSKLVAKINPYRIELIQGNVVTQEQLQIIRPGMSKNQIKEVLGTPLIVSLFHGDRWDYAFTIRRHGQPIQQRRLSVFFENDAMTRYDADPLPSEAEFAARIDIRRPSTAKIPPLQASPEQLAPFKPSAQNPEQTPSQGVFNGNAVSAQFPPLESP